MFDFIRNNRRFLQFVMMVLILPSFVFFGIQGYNRTGDGDPLASVGAQTISQTELDNAMRTQLENYKQQLGANFDAKMFDTPEVRKSVLDSLVNQKVVALEAQRANLVASDDKVREIVQSLPGVMVDGKYDAEGYKRYVASQNLRPDGFEAKTRNELGVQSLATAIQGTSLVSTALTENIASEFDRTRTVQALYELPANYLPQVTLTDAEIEQFYQTKRKQFELPERAKIEYVSLDTATLAKSMVVAEADLKSYYEQNKGRFGTPEERQASHILIKVDDKMSAADASAAKTKIDALLAVVKKSPNDFAKIAKESSQDAGSGAQGGDLGFFKREAMVKPFSDAAFLLKDGEISEPVKSQFGWHIIKLTGIKAANIKPLDAVKTELEGELKTQQASKKLIELTESFSNTVYDQGDNFKAVVDKFKLEIKTADGLNKDTMSKPVAAGQPVLFNAKLAEALFSADSIKNKKNTEAVEVTKGKLVSARLIEYTAPRVLPLSEVKATVEGQAKNEKAGKLAVAAGEAKLKSLLAKPDDTPIGLGAALTIARSKPESLPIEALKAIMSADTQKLPTWVGATLSNGQYALFKVSAVGDKPAIDAAKKANVKDALSRAYAQAEVLSVISVLRDRNGAKLLKTPAASDASKPATPGVN